MVLRWVRFALPFAVTLLIGGIYLLVVFKHRQEPGVVPGQQQQLTADDVAVVRMEFPQHFNDVKELAGKSVWMKNGNSMPFYPYIAEKVQWNKQVGLIPPAQRLEVKKAIEGAAPSDVQDNIGHGDSQALVVFSFPGESNLFATPVGFVAKPNLEQFYGDLLFYYDDPHTIYSNWPRELWAAIDAHQVKPGMSELETRMAIGMKAHPNGEKEGDRSVDYDVNGKHYLITYEHNRATSIKAQ